MTAGGTEAPPSPPPSMGPPYATLYVGDLDPEVGEKDILHCFSRFNPATVHVCRDRRSGDSLRYAYLNFRSYLLAEMALCEMNHASLNGKPMRIMWSCRNPAPRRSGAGNLFVKNLDYFVGGAELEGLFVQFGRVVSCKVATDERGWSRGFGFVQMESETAASSAIAALNDKLVPPATKKLYVSNFVKKSERNALQGKLKCNNLYIKNLDPEFTDGHLHEIFSLYGKVNSAVVMKNELGRSRGFGFVSFYSQEHALKAMVAMSGSKLGSKAIYVGLAQKKTVRQELMKLQFGKWGTQNPKKLQGASVYVKYLDFSVDDKELQEYFAECGTITSAKIMRDAHGQSRGFGFVCFSSPEEAKIAIKTFNGTMLHGKQLYVGMPKCKEDRHKDLLFQFPKTQSTTCIERYYSPYYSQPQNPIFMHQLCGMFSNQCKQVDIATNASWGNNVQHVNVPLQYPPFVPVYPLPGLYCTQMTKYENYGGHSINSYFGGVKQYGNSKKVKGIYYPRFNVSNPCDSPRRMKKTCRSAYLCNRT